MHGKRRSFIIVKDSIFTGKSVGIEASRSENLTTQALKKDVLSKLSLPANLFVQFLHDGKLVSDGLIDVHCKGDTTRLQTLHLSTAQLLGGADDHFKRVSADDAF